MTWRFAPALLVACSSAPTTPPVEPHPQPPDVAVVPEVVPAVVARVDLAVPSAPTSIVVLDGALYFTDSFGAIWKLPSDGSAPASQLSDGQHPNFAFHLFLAGSAVYATSRKDVLRVSADGSVTAMKLALADLPEESAGDADAIYLTVFKQNGVLRVPLSGGKPTKLADLARGVLGLHGSTLYAASYTGGTLVAIPVHGGGASPIAASLPKPTAVTADDRAVYVYCEKDRTVRRIDLADGGVHVIAGDLDNSDDLVADGGYIYTFTWGAQPGLVRITKDGSHAPQRLTTDLKTPNKVAIDRDAVYVSSRDQPRIIKLAKAALPRP